MLTNYSPFNERFVLLLKSYQLLIGCSTCSHQYALAGIPTMTWILNQDHGNNLEHGEQSFVHTSVAVVGSGNQPI